jgi:ribosomal-protein-alanine N-acetyltransferase
MTVSCEARSNCGALNPTGSISVMCWLEPSGDRVMTEALTEVADWALRQDGIWRIGGGTDVENLASARVMEKAGLTREGIFRRWIMHPNISPEPRDWVSYGKVR